MMTKKTINKLILAIYILPQQDAPDDDDEDEDVDDDDVEGFNNDIIIFSGDEDDAQGFDDDNDYNDDDWRLPIVIQYNVINFKY